MSKYPKLSYNHVKRYCDTKNLAFKTTEEVSPLQHIMGQDRGEAAMKFGLQIEHPSYNIYISGMKGTGRTTYTTEAVKKIATTKKVPDDWCYVYNFENTGKAIAINLPAGIGRDFQKDVDELIQDLLIEVPRAFNSEDYDRHRNEIIKEYQEQKNNLLYELSEYADKKNFSIKNTNDGFMFVPLQDNGEEITEEQIKQMDEATTEALEVQLEEIQEKALDILLKIKNIEKLTKKKLLQLEMRVGLFVVKPRVYNLTEKYKESKKVIEHLKQMERDLIENIYQFVGEEEEVTDTSSKIKSQSFIKKYRVNLLVNNKELKGAPVITELNPTLNKLTGNIEYENVNGVLRTDFLQIKPGAIHLANGGYLILEAKQLLTNPYAWETLKRVLQTKEITVENMGNQLGIDVTSLKLQPIPVDLKVIIIGSEYLYHLLYNHDEDFEKYFKVLVDFDSEMTRDSETEKQMASFITCYVKREEMKDFSVSAVARIIEYSSRLTGNQKKLTARFNKVIEIIIEANQWAKLDASTIVTEEHVNKAIKEKWNRINKYQKKVEESFESKKILIDIEGKKIGVVNGLSVMNLGEYSFGKPSVITVTTSAGKEGIVNIEKEVNLSGNIYDKGIMILTGFLMENFAQDTTLSISARICFEQSYGGVDGDSASSAELYALLSSISGIPLKQHIAITGSVNQRGYIQPVGGVTEKVEGFFRLCKKRGLTGSQGVIIPHQNIENLMLIDEVVEAIKNQQFHIYVVKHVNEGIEIMTGESYEKVYEEVGKKLKYYNHIVEIN